MECVFSHATTLRLVYRLDHDDSHHQSIDPSSHEEDVVVVAAALILDVSVLH